MKTKYRATFSKHTQTRTSHREYAAAWAVYHDGRCIGDGFSRTFDLARKASDGWWRGEARCEREVVAVEII